MTHESLYKYQYRSQDTQHGMRWLIPNQNLPGPGLAVANLIWNTAEEMAAFLHDGSELTAGLRKLREAKDCFVIQSLVDLEEEANAPQS